MHWDKVTRGQRGTSFEQHLLDLQSLPAGSKLRLNQAGDLPTDPAMLWQLTAAVRHLQAWTYTHHDLPVSTTRQMKRDGLTVNHSCETVQQAKEVVAAGGLATMVTTPDAPKGWRDGDVVFRQCPATVEGSSVTCERCMLCHERPQHHVITFPAHGAARKQAASKVEV
jgi:hypothetical protein